MKLYLDKKLKKYIVPTELRDNSDFDGSVFTSGTRIPIDLNSKYIRLFVSWCGLNNEATNIDIDLSACFIYKEEGKYLSEEIAYYNQQSNIASHSGDITSSIAYDGEKMTGEFIDIDIEEARLKYNYILINNYIFNEYNFNDMLAYSGIELLNNRTNKTNLIGMTNSIFKMRLQGDFTNNIPIAIDLKTNEIVIIDSYTIEYSGNTIGYLKNKLELYKEHYFEANKNKENMYNFLKMYSKAKNIELTKNKDEADYICDYKDGDKVFNIAKNLENILGVL